MGTNGRIFVARLRIATGPCRYAERQTRVQGPASRALATAPRVPRASALKARLCSALAGREWLRYTRSGRRSAGVHCTCTSRAFSNCMKVSLGRDEPAAIPMKDFPRASFSTTSDVYTAAPVPSQKIRRVMARYPDGPMDKLRAWRAALPSNHQPGPARRRNLSVNLRTLPARNGRFGRFLETMNGGLYCSWPRILL
jgi:hypothetical protein